MKLRPLVIPVFIPHEGCPHRCIFCDQAAITQTPNKLPFGAELISQALERYQSHGRNPDRPTEIAFFGGNFLGLPDDKIVALLNAAARGVDQGRFDSIRFSTRPDTIGNQKMDLIAPFPIKTIEIGAQSMDDRVLTAAHRGHSVQATVRAVERLKKEQYQTGLQLMVGLPAENQQTIEMNSTAVCELAPDYVRIYPTLVLANSPLAAAFHQGCYQPLALGEAVRRTASLVVRFLKKRIAVIRMGLPADVAIDSAQLLAGPYHPAFGHLVYSEIFLDMAIRELESSNSNGQTIALHVHPRSVSKMRGLKNRNIETLRENFHFQSVEIVPDDSLKEDQILFCDPVTNSRS